MKPLPFPLFRAVQGLLYPHRGNILVKGDWHSHDWRTTHAIQDSLNSDVDVVITPINMLELPALLEKYNDKNFHFHLVLHTFNEGDFDDLFNKIDDFFILPCSIGVIGIGINPLGKKSFLGDKLLANDVVDIDDEQLFLPHFSRIKWRQEGINVFFEAPEETILFKVPVDFSLRRTSSDLLWAVEHVLLYPWHDVRKEAWVPTRRPGLNPGLSFSGGLDSTAAMCLMPDDTILFYMQRNFKSMLHHENALRFIQHLRELERKVIIVKSNHEKIRTHYGKNPGFSTDYACMAHLILLADYFDLDSAGTGMPLENAYFFHGSRVRNFEESGFWKINSPIFAYLGIPLYQPVAGCSEVLNNHIVQSYGFGEYATSCLRSTETGETCNKCWKCFRKNTFNQMPWEMSSEIQQFLGKRPLKQGVATLYAIQMIKNEGGPIPEEVMDLEAILDVDLNFMDNYWQPSLNLLPDKYREYTKHNLNEMTTPMKINLYEINQEIEQYLRGEII